MHPELALRRALLTALIVAFCAPSTATAQARQNRMVIASGVACRAEPGPDAPLQRRHTVGDVFAVGDEVEVGGATWYLDSGQARGGSRGCWLYGPLTVPYDRRDTQPALLAAADHILGREDTPLLVEWVAVENLLLEDQAPYYRGPPPPEIPPLLQLRRLQIVQGAVGAHDASRVAVARDPMKRAWIIAHADLIRGFEPSGGWVVEAEAYWRLYDQHRDTDAADEIAWVAANGYVPADECYAACLLDRASRTSGRYLRERPAGVHVAEALARSTRAAELAARYGCQEWERESARDRARELLDAVQRIAAPEKAALIAHLEAVQRACR